MIAMHNSFTTAWQSFAVPGLRRKACHEDAQINPEVVTQQQMRHGQKWQVAWHLQRPALRWWQHSRQLQSTRKSVGHTAVTAVCTSARMHSGRSTLSSPRALTWLEGRGRRLKGLPGEATCWQDLNVASGRPLLGVAVA